MSSSFSKELGITELVLIVLLVLVLIGLSIFLYRWWYKRKHTQSYDASVMLPLDQKSTTTHPLLDQCVTIPVDNGWNFLLDSARLAELIEERKLISTDCLKLGDELGHGNFGVVYKATYREPISTNNLPVAAKTIKKIRE